MIAPRWGGRETRIRVADEVHAVQALDLMRWEDGPASEAWCRRCLEDGRTSEAWRRGRWEDGPTSEAHGRRLTRTAASGGSDHLVPG